MEKTVDKEGVEEGIYFLASACMLEQPFPARLISTVKVQLGAANEAGTRRGDVTLSLPRGEVLMHDDPHVVIETTTLGNGQFEFLRSTLTTLDPLEAVGPDMSWARLCLRPINCHWLDTGEPVTLWVGGHPWSHVLRLLRRAERLIGTGPKNQPISIKLDLVVDLATPSELQIKVTNLL